VGFGSVYKIPKKKNETNIFPIRTKQASLIKDLLLWLITNLRTAKRISISKRALQRRKKGTNDCHNVIFSEFFAKIMGKTARTRFLLHTKLSSHLKFYEKHDLVRSFREQSILAVRLGKFGPLRQPIRKLLFSADEFSHIINLCILC